MFPDREAGPTLPEQLRLLRELRQRLRPAARGLADLGSAADASGGRLDRRAPCAVRDWEASVPLARSEELQTNTSTTRRTPRTFQTEVAKQSHAQGHSYVRSWWISERFR